MALVRLLFDGQLVGVDVFSLLVWIELQLLQLLSLQ